MKIIAKRENKNIAGVYLAENDHGKVLEFAESLQPPKSINEKWVIIISTLYGCPVRCKMCDAGSSGPYAGPVSVKEMFAQIDFLVKERFGNNPPITDLFKIQFARMGEPSFNKEVLKVLRELPKKYPVSGLMPSVSTIAPKGQDEFFKELKKIKDELYPDGKFQLQFSIHTTDQEKRDWLVPVKKWSFEEISAYGDYFLEKGDRKITLNFALAKEMPLSPDVLAAHFSPDKFLIKITPLNPTVQSKSNELSSFVKDDAIEADDLIRSLNNKGFEAFVSIGETEENQIGSNCGQFVTKYLAEKSEIGGGYGYWSKL